VYDFFGKSRMPEILMAEKNVAYIFLHFALTLQSYTDLPRFFPTVYREQCYLNIFHEVDRSYSYKQLPFKWHIAIPKKRVRIKI
jgi:hypothetical protein